MELCYRGVSYDYDSLFVATTVGQVGGKYRGQDWRLCNLNKTSVQQPKNSDHYNNDCTIIAKIFNTKKIQGYLANL